MDLTFVLTRLAVMLGLAGVVSACISVPVGPANSSEPTTELTAPEASPSPTAAERAFRIVGYSTNPLVVTTAQLDRLTHVNYAFVVPNADGTFVDVAKGRGLDRMVAAAHERGVQVLVSVAGANADSQMEALAADPAARATLVAGLVEFVEAYELDGVDMDWEFPDAGESADRFVELMHELRAALEPRDKLLTAAVAALGAPHADAFPDEVFEDVDFLNLMVYDGPGPNHSPFGFAEASLDYWLGRGLPPEKAVLGVPFYSRPIVRSYRELVADDPGAALSDQIDVSGMAVYYNGLPTIHHKTELALERAGGIMIWTLGDDTLDQTSLLAAIYETAYRESGGT